jgi:glucose/arabinose dehydrogenase
MRQLALKCLGLVAATLLANAAPASAQIKVKLEEVASGLTHPLAMVSIPDGTGRKAVIEQPGVVRIIDAKGRLLPEPFLDLQPKIITLKHFFDERGLLGIAFHPNYKDNGKFYVAYSAPLRGNALDKKLWWSHTNVVSEFQVSKADPNKADAGLEKVINELDWPQFNHNGQRLGHRP